MRRFDFSRAFDVRFSPENVSFSAFQTFFSKYGFKSRNMCPLLFNACAPRACQRGRRSRITAGQRPFLPFFEKSSVLSFGTKNSRFLKGQRFFKTGPVFVLSAGQRPFSIRVLNGQVFFKSRFFLSFSRRFFVLSSWLTPLFLEAYHD